MKRSIVLFMVPFFIFSCLIFIFTQWACGDFGMTVQAEKNIPFNHYTHVQKRGASCESCHSYADNGRFKGIPTVGDCKVCHQENDPQSADYDPKGAMRLPYLAAYKDSDRPWQSYVRQTGLVYFSHQVVMNVKWKDGSKESKVSCASCHGGKAFSEKETEKVTSRMPMGECMDCHDAINVSNKCAVCHD